MADGIYIALTGAVAQQQALDAAAHNVANASTTGFRGDRLVFAQVLRGAQPNSSVASQTQARSPTPASYVRVEQSVMDTESGYLKETGNTLDLALSGDGYFMVRTPQGDRLTRAGAFRVDALRRISSPDGAQVLGENGEPISLPEGVTDITVSPNGLIRANGTDVARLSLKTVADPAALIREGATTYKPGAGALLQATDVSVSQGYLESSNVNAIEGVEQVGDISAAFSALMKVIESFQQVDSRTARDLGSRTA